MSQFQSKEAVAATVSSGIEASAEGITSPTGVGLDVSSQYQGNNTAHSKIECEAGYAGSVAGILNQFVALIRSTAAEFAGMDRHIAAQIENRTATLPQTSAVPDSSADTSAGFEPNPTLFEEN